MKSNLSMFFSTMDCFNVASIAVLAIWHDYVSYLNQAINRTLPGPMIESTLIPTLVNTSRRTLMIGSSITFFGGCM
jgi:hypothetical protein